MLAEHLRPALIAATVAVVTVTTIPAACAAYVAHENRNRPIERVVEVVVEEVEPRPTAYQVCLRHTASSSALEDQQCAKLFGAKHDQVRQEESGR